MKLLKNYPLKKLNTFGIETYADSLAFINNEKDLLELAASNEFNEKRKFVLGGGSNVLFTKDFDGLIIHPAIDTIRLIESSQEYAIIEAGAGVKWHNFVETSVNNKYYGLENLALIPGNVGSAPVQNIGAYGTEQGVNIHSVRGLNLESMEFCELDKDECSFGYRNSIFKNALKEKFIITSVRYKLSRKENLNLSYKELADELSKFVVVETNARSVFNAVCRIRQRKLPDPRVLGNAGSFFKNPVISKSNFDEIAPKFPEMPSYQTIIGSSDTLYVKLSAGWLIEKCGWKGRRIGDAGVSEKHALVLVNYGNASGKDIMDLARQIGESVIEKFGVRLEYEVNVI